MMMNFTVGDIMDTIKKTLLYAGLDRDEYNRLLPQAQEENAGKLKTYALVSFGIFLWLCLTSLSFHLFPVKVSVSYGVAALLSLVVFALARASAIPPATLCYIFVGGLYAFSLVSNALNPSLPAIGAIAIMLMGAFLFTERPLNLIVMNAIAVLLLCVISFSIKSRRLAFIDLGYSVVFCVISVAAEITQERLRFRLLAQTDRIKYLGETDVLTGCKNRNCFQDRLDSFPSACKKSLVCVYIDVNGLHNLNDSQGHEAGDRMLKSVASALLDTFDPENTYRIGGDEFVVVCPDASLEETRRKMENVAASLSRQGYDISTGIEQGDKDALDMDKLIKKAEAGMYREKEAYYQQAGHDRRRMC